MALDLLGLDRMIWVGHSWIEASAVDLNQKVGIINGLWASCDFIAVECDDLVADLIVPLINGFVFDGIHDFFSRERERFQ